MTLEIRKNKGGEGRQLLSDWDFKKHPQSVVEKLSLISFFKLQSTSGLATTCLVQLESLFVPSLQTGEHFGLFSGDSQKHMSYALTS